MVWARCAQTKGLFRCILARNGKHKPCAEFEGIGEDLALVDVGQFVVAIVEFLKDLLLLIVQRGE